MNHLIRFKLIRFFITISVILAFLLGVFLIWYIFIYKNTLSNITEKIAATIASFGLLLSGVQISINEIKRKREFYKQIRYSEYKIIKNLVQRFTNVLNDYMINELDPNVLENQLLNLNNELATIIISSNSKLFPGIIHNEHSQKTGNLISDITFSASEYRKRIDVINIDKNGKLFDEGIIETHKMDWHIEIGEKLKELHIEKYKLFQFLENYI